MRTDNARLRTRIGKDGMDYKGYNIAVHEFGHNVEQTITLHDVIKDITESTSARPVPKWLDLDKQNQQGKVVAMATREDIDLPIEETLIVELYSK